MIKKKAKSKGDIGGRQKAGAGEGEMSDDGKSGTVRGMTDEVIKGKGSEGVSRMLMQRQRVEEYRGERKCRIRVKRVDVRGCRVKKRSSWRE